MKKQTMPTGFSGFAWGIAAFCLPILLWPMASLLSTSFVKNPTLSDFQIDLFSIIFWVYPFVLVLIARLLYKLHQYIFLFTKIIFEIQQLLLGLLLH